MNIYQNYIKIWIDRLLALLLLPFFLVVLIMVLIPQLLLYKNIFFYQARPGKNSRIIKLWKFQTMVKGTGTDEVRITKFGEILRILSLDELPQIINILKGEMSFVGPRPLLPEYLPLYSSDHSKRHDVLPGITGLAQVNGREVNSWSDKFDYDVAYTRKISFLLDLKIVSKTFRLLFLPGVEPKEIIKGKFTGYDL